MCEDVAGTWISRTWPFRLILRASNLTASMRRWKLSQKLKQFKNLWLHRTEQKDTKPTWHWWARMTCQQHCLRRLSTRCRDWQSSHRRRYTRVPGEIDYTTMCSPPSRRLPVHSTQARSLTIGDHTSRKSGSYKRCPGASFLPQRKLLKQRYDRDKSIFVIWL